MTADDSITPLLNGSFDATREFREIYKNQQETLAGLAALLENHTAVLRWHQHAIESLASATGLTFEPEDPTAPPIN